MAPGKRKNKQIDDEFSESNNHIAIITAEGVIMEGEITQGVAGANGVVKQIRSAHEDENTKAIVFLRSSASSRSKLNAKTATSGYFFEKETISGISLIHGGHQSAQ